MTEFLEADLDEITIEKIANHCSFENLKNVKTFDLFFVKNSPKSDATDGYIDVGDLFL